MSSICLATVIGSGMAMEANERQSWELCWVYGEEELSSHRWVVSLEVLVAVCQEEANTREET